MKLTIDVESVGDWQRAMDALLALRPVFEPAVAPEVDAPAANPGTGCTVRADEDIPCVEVETEALKNARLRGKERRARKANGAADPVQQDVAAKPTATTESDDAAREKLRQLAVERGVAWFRGLLASYGAARLGDLTAAQIQEALDAAA